MLRTAYHHVVARGDPEQSRVPIFGVRWQKLKNQVLTVCASGLTIFLAYCTLLLITLLNNGKWKMRDEVHDDNPIVKRAK